MMPIGNVSSIFWENARRLCRYMILIQPNHWSDHASAPYKVKKSNGLAGSLELTSDGLLWYSSKSDFQIASWSHLQMLYNFF